MRRLSGVIRHRVVCRDLERSGGSRLPDAYELTQVFGQDCLARASWQHTAASSYPTWERHGARCMLGEVDGTAVFRTWCSMNPSIVTRLVPWARANDTPAYLFDIETLAAHRNQGYSGVFLAELLRRLAVGGARQAYARVLPGNDVSLRLFAALGFYDDGTLVQASLLGRRLGSWRGR